MADGDAAPSKSSQSLAAIDVGAGEGHDEFRRRGGSIDRLAGAQPRQHAHAVLNRGSAVFRTSRPSPPSGGREYRARSREAGRSCRVRGVRRDKQSVAYVFDGQVLVG